MALCRPHFTSCVHFKLSGNRSVSRDMFAVCCCCHIVFFLVLRQLAGFSFIVAQQEINVQRIIRSRSHKINKRTHSFSLSKTSPWCACVTVSCIRTVHLLNELFEPIDQFAAAAVVYLFIQFSPFFIHISVK